MSHSQSHTMPDPARAADQQPGSGSGSGSGSGPVPSCLPPLRIPSPPRTQPRSGSRIYNAVFSNRPHNRSPSTISNSAQIHSESLQHQHQHQTHDSISIPIPRSRSATIGRGRQTRQSVLSKPSLASLNSVSNDQLPQCESPSSIRFEQADADQLDLLDVLDPAVRAASTLTHIQNSLFLPPSINYFSSSPLIELQNPVPDPSLSAPPEPAPPHPAPVSDPLDDHLVAILDPQHRQPKMSIQIKRIFLGIWAFMATPIGILFTIYGFLVVFWGAALVLILFKWLKLKNEHQYRVWVEICSQILNGLFTITGIGLLPSRIIDWYNASIILHYARHIWRRHGRSTLEDPNDLVPPPPPPPSSTIAGSLPDVWKDDSEIVLSEPEVAKLRKAQEKLCRSQTWYRPHSSATHYAFPIRWTLVILGFNLGNSVFQAGLCGVMWGLTYTNRPAWTTGTLMGLSFSCGLASALLIWRISVLTLKSKQVYSQVEKALASGSCSGGVDGSVKTCNNNNNNRRKLRSSVVAEQGTTAEDRGMEDLPLVGNEKGRGCNRSEGEDEEGNKSDGDVSKEEDGDRGVLVTGQSVEDGEVGESRLSKLQ